MQRQMFRQSPMYERQTWPQMLNVQTRPNDTDEVVLPLFSWPFLFANNDYIYALSADWIRRVYDLFPSF